MKKEHISVLLIIAIILVTFASCGDNKSTSKSATASSSIRATVSDTEATATTISTNPVSETKKASAKPATTKKASTYVSDFGSLNAGSEVYNDGQYSAYKDDVYYIFKNQIIRTCNVKTGMQRELVFFKKPIRDFKLFGNYLSICCYGQFGTYDYFVYDMNTGITKSVINKEFVNDHFIVGKYLCLYNNIFDYTDESYQTNPSIYTYDLSLDDIQNTENFLTKGYRIYNPVIAGNYIFGNGCVEDNITPPVPSGEGSLLRLDVSTGKIKFYDSSLTIFNNEWHPLQNNNWIMVRKNNARYFMSVKTDKLFPVTKKCSSFGVIGDVMIEFLMPEPKVLQTGRDIQTKTEIILTNLNNNAVCTLKFDFIPRLPNLASTETNSSPIYTIGGVIFYSKMLTFNVSDTGVTLNQIKTPIKSIYDGTSDGTISKAKKALFTINNSIMYIEENYIKFINVNNPSATDNRRIELA